MPELEMPKDDRAEAATLGCMFLENGKAIPDVQEVLKAEDFYHPALRSIFEVMTLLHAQDKPITRVSVAAELERLQLLSGIGGHAYLNEIAGSEFTPSWAKHYALIVRDRAIKRGLIEKANKIAGVCYMGSETGPDALAQASAEIASLYRDEGVRDCQSFAELSKPFYTKLEEDYERGGGLSGISTGWSDVDDLTGGLSPGQVFVVGARPGMGKTAWALSLLRNTARQGKVSVLLSLEMSKEELYQRLVAAEACVNLNNIRRARLTDAEWGRVSEANARLYEMTGYIDFCAGLAVSATIPYLSRLKLRYGGLDLVIIDYLQLMTGIDGKRYPNRNEEVGDISRGLKSLANTFSIPCVALAQLNRDVEGRGDKRPLLGDLRESGSIEQDADNVAFLYRDSYYEGQMTLTEDDGSPVAEELEFIIAKQRNGPLKTVVQAVRLPYCRVDDMARSY